MAKKDKTASVNWNSSLGAVLAVAGSAVGFGNFLRFPGLAAQYGGSAFMIAYFCAFLLLGVPLSWVEWSMGRRGGILGGHSCASIFMLISHAPAWKYVGILGVIAPLGLGMYYMYLEGWTLGYAYHTAVGDLQFADSGGFGNFFADFVGLAGDGSAYDWEKTKVALFFGVSVIANLYVLYRGVTKGIEWFCKWSMPVLLLTAMIVLVRVLTLGTPDAAHPERSVDEGLGYMWNPEKTVLVVNDQGKEKTVGMLPAQGTQEQRAAVFASVQQANPGKRVEMRRITLLQGLMNPDLWVTAAGQIFFSLSIGYGVVLSYASHVARNGDIALSSLTSNAANEVVEVGIAGMMIVPAAVSLLGVAAAAGASTFGLGFNVLPEVFAAMPGGRIFGTLFFGLLFLAAISSSISLLYPALAFLEEFWNLTRPQSVVVISLFMLVGSGMVSWFTGGGLMALDTLDFWIGTMCLYLISAMHLSLYRFVWGTRNGVRELRRGAAMPLPRGLGFVINWITPTILFTIFTAWFYKNVFISACPQIHNIRNGEIGAILPLAWCLVIILFMAFVVHTSKHYRRHCKLEQQKERIPFS